MKMTLTSIGSWVQNESNSTSTPAHLNLMLLGPSQRVMGEWRGRCTHS